MSKKDKSKQTFDLKSLFVNQKPTDTHDLDFEEALSKGLLYSLVMFQESSHITRTESRDMAILMSTNKTQKAMCSKIINHRKDYKRKARSEWITIIKSIASSIKRDNENTGLLSFMKRER